MVAYELAEKPRFKCFHCGQPYIYKCEADCSKDPINRGD